MLDGWCALQVKIALEAHARQLGTTLADVMWGVGTQTRRSLADFTSEPSQRFTASRHMSLLRAAGVESLGLGQKKGVNGSNPGSPTGSQASSGNSELVAPVAQLADFDGTYTIEDGVVSCGNEAVMNPDAFSAGDLGQDTGVRLTNLASETYSHLHFVSSIPSVCVLCRSPTAMCRQRMSV